MHLEKEFCDVECVGVENIWPTPLAYYKYPEDKQEEFKQAVRRAIKKVEGGKNDWQDNIWHFYQHANEHLLNDNKDEPVFEHFHTWLKSCYKDYVITLQKWDMDPNAFVTDCWVNITKKGGEQVIHTHANAFVSGTYYVRLDPGVGGIAFNNPNIMPNRPYIGCNAGDMSIYNASGWMGAQKEGVLILWPGHVAHHTEKTTDGTRVSVSMNFTPEVFTAGAYRYRIAQE